MALRAKLALLLVLAVTTLDVAVEQAHAATTQIGAVQEIQAAAAPSPLAAGGVTVQVGEANGTYAVPSGYGTITAWSHRAGTAGGPLTFRVYRPTGEPQQFGAIASDARIVTTGTVQTFAVSIPVQPGDRIGLTSDDVQLAYESDFSLDRIGFLFAEPSNGSTISTYGDPVENYKLDVTATLRSGPTPGGAGQPSPGGAAPAPSLTALSLAPHAFKAARRGPSASASEHRRHGAKVGYRVDRAADVRFSVQQIRPGRRTAAGAGGRCVAQTKLDRPGSPCLRSVPLAGAFTRVAHAGANHFDFSGRLGHAALSPGVYRLLATPTADGRTGKRVGRLFQISR